MTGDEIALQLNDSTPKVLISGDLSVQTEYSFLKVFLKPVDFEEVTAFLVTFNSTAKKSKI